MSGSLAGKVALVTGGSRGIGAAIAMRLAAEGAAVAITARSLDTNPDHLPGNLAEVVARIEAAGGRALAVQADLSQPESRARIVPRVREVLGEVDILVNNAAASLYRPFDRLSRNSRRIAFEINCMGPWDLCEDVVPAMRARGRGWILNISTDVARPPEGPPYPEFHQFGGVLAYATSKAALNRLTIGLAAELYRDGIAVNSVEPVAIVMTPGVEAQDLPLEGHTVEPVEAMCEAALAMCSEPASVRTGLVVKATPFLESIGRRVRTLDGRALFEAA